MMGNDVANNDETSVDWKPYWDKIHRDQRIVWDEFQRKYKALGKSALSRLPEKNIPISIGTREYLLRDMELDMGDDEHHLVIQEIYRRYGKGGKNKIILRMLLRDNTPTKDEQDGKVLFELDPNKVTEDVDDSPYLFISDHARRNYSDIEELSKNIAQWPVYYR